MDLESFHELGNDLYHRLHLPTYPVAIKFIKKEDEIPKEAIRPSAGGQKWSLCQAFTYARRMGLHSAMTDDDNFCVPSIVLRGSACSVRYIGPPPRGTIMLPFTGVVIDCNRRQRMTAQMGIRVNAETVKAWVLARGVDLVGIADADNLLLSYPPRPAAALMPSAKSVIVMAVAHTLGSVYAPDIMLWTRSKMQTSRLLDETAEKLGRRLEREGFLALPISADKPVEIFKKNPKTGKKFRQTRTAAFLSFKHAAVSCGMGAIGRNNLLLTPEFGPHQRLCAIVTEAPLEPDPRQNLDLCCGCDRCVKACPSGALEPDRYDVDPCFVYWSMGFKRLPPASFREWPGYIRMLRRHMQQRDFLVESGQAYITDVDYCIECMRACPVGENWKKIRPKAMPSQKSNAHV